MTSPWLASKTPVGPPTAANPTVRQLLYAAAVTGGWSGLISLVIYLIGRLFGMTFTVAVQGGTTPEPVPWFVVLLLPLVAAVVGALLASLARGWPHAGRIVFWVGTLGALVSLIAGPEPAGLGRLVHPHRAGAHARRHVVPRGAPDRPHRRRLRAGPARGPR